MFHCKHVLLSLWFWAQIDNEAFSWVKSWDIFLGWHEAFELSYEIFIDAVVDLGENVSGSDWHIEISSESYVCVILAFVGVSLSLLFQVARCLGISWIVRNSSACWVIFSFGATGLSISGRLLGKSCNEWCDGVYQSWLHCMSEKFKQ